jgi:type I restriction enzyme S subunit
VILDSIATAIVDCEHKTAPAGDGYALSVGTRAMKDGQIIADACKPVSQGTFDVWTRRMRPEPGDLILAREAPVGQVVRVPEGTRVCLGQRTVLIRPDPRAVNPRFLHYWLLGPAAQHLMASQAAGATVPHLNVADIRDLDASDLPASRAVQAFAAGLLGAIDDLIENNRRRVEVLEEMARAIYREWFVHFRYPGPRGRHSPLGPIPEGWAVRPLGDIANLDRTSVQPARSPGEVFDHYSIPAFDDGQLPVADAGSMIKSGKFLVTAPGVMVSKLNPRIERTWFAEPGVERRSVASTEFLVLRPGTHLMARSEPFQDRLRELSGGTSTSHQRAKPADFLGLEVLEPAAGPTDRITEATAAQLRLARDLRVRSRRLAAIRDLLLPKLVTGQIDVSSLDLDAVVAG